MREREELDSIAKVCFSYPNAGAVGDGFRHFLRSARTYSFSPTKTLLSFTICQLNHLIFSRLSIQAMIHHQAAFPRAI
jgi:hypothetical protein